MFGLEVRDDGLIDEPDSCPLRLWILALRHRMGIIHQVPLAIRSACER